MMMTVNLTPSATALRDGSGTGGFRQINTDYPDQDIRRLREEECRVLNFESQHSELQRDKERAKKDKKWSLGKLFRRKKKEDDSGSSSGSDEGVSTRSETKRKVKKRKRPAAISVNNFDHIVVNRDQRRAQSVVKQNTKDVIDEGVLSDPSAGFVGYRNKLLTQVPNYITSKETLHPRDDSATRSGNTSLDGSVRRSRKGRMKARVEALRNSMRKDSSSDEESQKSSTSSSMLRFRSDDSLMNNLQPRDGSLNRKSRSARTERYIKRLSRDEENQLNKEAELLQQGYTKAEVEMLTRTPTSQSSGYGTSKRENPYANAKPENIYSNDMQRRTLKSESISSFPSTHSYPSSINFNAKINNETVHYSVPYVRNNVCREPMYVNQIPNQRLPERHSSIGKDNVMCVKFPLGNVTNIAREDKAPPVPPPRDMQRKISTPISMLTENDNCRNRISTEDRTHGIVNNDFQRIMRRSQERTLNPIINGLRRPLSNSEDHIAMENKDNYHYSNLRRPDQQRRPASVSVETNHYGLYANTAWRNRIENPNIIKPQAVKQDFLYYADQSPRSRRPISIQSSQTNLDKPCMSDSQSSLNHHINNIDFSQRRPRNASEFWRKIDNEECQRKSQNAYPLSRTMSENSTPSVLNSRVGMHINGSRFNREPSVPHNVTNDPNFNHNGNRLTLHNTSRDMVDSSHKWKSATEYRPQFDDFPRIVNPPQRTHVRHKSETYVASSYKSPSDEEKSSERRKSTNLDDALNELEAIYNSLGLGDEDLLDRAERRELMSPKCNTVPFDDWNGNNSIQLQSQPSTPLKKVIQRRSTLPDRIQDDMAFRRLNSNDKSVTKDSPTANISYMLASPVYVPYAYEDDKHSETDPQEPDIIQDDVVYRNIRHSKNHLKQLEPQPPFGIPVGPVTPAPQSDYLHAIPDNKGRSRFVPRRSPDLVSDDLAYRALRKDNRHTSFFVDDPASNNNNSYNELAFEKDSPANLKKKRAVRSLSANIFTMIQKEIDEALNMSKLATLQKTQSISDVNKKLSQINSNNNEDTSPRNKVKHRHNTVDIIVSNSQSSIQDFKDRDDKYLAKPPSGERSSSSPSNRSPQPTKKPAKKEFQQVLSMLAQEAMDTSNKLGVALAELDRKGNNNWKVNNKPERLSNSQARAMFLNSLSNKNSTCNDPEIQPFKLHSEVINPRTEKYQTHNTEKAKKTADSLLAISDQLHKVEDKLKHSFERVVNVPDESLKLSTCKLQDDEKLKAQECKTTVPEIKSSPTVFEPKVQEDVVMVQNTENIRPMSITSPAKTKVQVNELNELQSFNELKEGISDLLAGISQVNEKLFKGNTTIVSKSDDSERNSISISVYEDELVNYKDNADNAEYNSSEELATIFKLDEKPPEDKKSEPETNKEDDKHSDLNSPRLVRSMNQQLRRFSDDCTDSQMDKCQPSQSNAVATVPWRTKQHNSGSQSEKKDCVVEAKSRAWYSDPTTLMLACSYAIVYSQQLADLDWLTLLGLLLAIITIIAMLII